MNIGLRLKYRMSILDAHHSRMDIETTLAKLCTEDASNGVPLQDSHSNEISRTLGRSVEAKLEGERAVATFSMLRDAPETPDNMKVGEYIRRVERGMFTDVSVGFSSGQDICDIDGLDIWGRSQGDEVCLHWPGETYDGKVATYTVTGARLAEVSLVPAGSNPNTVVLARSSLMTYELENSKTGTGKKT